MAKAAQKQTVTLPGYMGKPWDVTGEIHAGLILHKMGQSWVLSHVASGCRVGSGWRLQKDARDVLAKLLALGCDWSHKAVPDVAASCGMAAGDFADACKRIAY